MQVEQEQGFMEEAALGFGLRRGTIVIFAEASRAG
jgi:hypothetical protein